MTWTSTKCLTSAAFFVEMALDDIRRAELPEATPLQRKARYEQAATAIGEASMAIAKAGALLALEILRSRGAA